MLILVATSSLALATRTVAQTVFDQNGFGANRDSYTVLPYEYVDPLSGNLLLVVTDLTLPGNAGFDLAVKRVYNSAVYPHYANNGDRTLDEDSWAGIGWRLHFGRVLYETDPNQPTQIEMPDGSRHQLYHSPTSDGWITKEFWVYNKSTHMLKLPNGTVYTFGRDIYISAYGPTPVRYVTQMSDPFNNTVTFGYFDANGPADGVASIHQDLGLGQARDITFTYDPTLKALQSMSYNGMTWSYGQGAFGPPGFSALQSVQPPAGQPWHYYYGPTGYVGLTSMVVPGGGVVSYTYDDADRVAGSTTQHSRVVVQRSISGDRITPGTWMFQYDQGDNKDTTVVSCSCGVTRYRYNGVGLNGNGSFAAWWVGTLAERDVFEANGTTLLEQELLTWQQSDAISTDSVPATNGIWGDPAIYTALTQQRDIRRAPYTWTTYYDYHFGQGNYNDYGRAYRIREVGDLSRTTTRAFEYGISGRYIVDRVHTETIQIGSEIISTTTDYDSGTGFATHIGAPGVNASFTATAQGNVASVTDANTHTTTFGYQWGVRANWNTPKVSTSRSIDPAGVVLSESIGSLTTTFQYDAGLRLKKVQPPGTGRDAIFYEYDVNDGWVWISRGTGQTNYQLDGFGRVVSSNNRLNLQTDITRDACGRGIAQTMPYTPGVTSLIRSTSTQYDALGRVVQVTAADGTVTVQNAYDGSNIRVTDADHHETLYKSKGFGHPTDGARLTSVIDANGLNTSYDYDVFGHMTQQTLNGNLAYARTWVYNGQGRLDHDAQPESGTTTYLYDAVGNVTRITEANGRITNLTYDENNRLTSRDADGTEADLTLTYDPVYGRLVTQQTPQVTTTWSYDNAGRVSQRLDNLGGWPVGSSYLYDGSDHLTRINYPTGNRYVDYTYDIEGRLLTVSQNGNTFANNFSYDDGGRLASFMTGSVTQATTYDARDRVSHLTAGNGAPQLDLTYHYTPAGNVSGIEDVRPSSSHGFDQTFGYDVLNRLTTANGPYGALSWGLGSSGNRYNDIRDGAVTNYSYDNAFRLISLSGRENETFTYDAAGQLTSDSRGRYTYNGVGLLARVTDAATGATELGRYLYDADNLRMQRIVGGRTILSLRGGDGRTLSEYENQCGTMIWTRDLIYGAGRLLGAVKAPPTLPTVSFSAANIDGPESIGNAAFNVVLTTPNGGALACGVDVAYRTTPGTAASTADYAETSGTLTFAPGSANGTTKTILVPIINDASQEPDEAFTVTLSNPLGATLGAIASEAFTIHDNDPAPSLTMSPINVNEGAGPAIFTVNVSNPSGFVIDLNYLTNDGTAHAGSDFTAPPVPSVLHIPAGAASATIAIPITDDRFAEGDETFVLQIYNPVHATLGSTGAWATIIDNERPRAEISSSLQGVFFADATAKIGFDDYIVIGNRWSGGPVPARLTFTRADGSGFTHDVTVPQYGRLSLRVGDEPGLTDEDVSVAVQSLDPSHRVDADHSVYWGPGLQSGRSTEGVTPSNQWYFAEGSVANFDEYVTIYNPTSSPQQVWVFFYGPSGYVSGFSTWIESGPGRQKIHVNEALPAGSPTDVSMYITCPTAGIVAERTMTWWLGGGEVEGHSSPGVPAGSADWYFAEGDTGFATYFPLFNLANATSHVQVDYLHANGNLYSQVVDVAPYARVTLIPPAMPPGSFGAHIHASTPVAAERSLYGGPNWTLGTNGVGATAPLLNTYLSEGATGSFWDTYILIANPSNSATAHVSLAFITEGGALTSYNVAVAPHSRQSVFVDAVPGMASANFRTEVGSDIPVVAERVTYWPGSSGSNLLAAGFGGKIPMSAAGTVSPEPTLGFNPYTTTRPRAPVATLGFYQIVTEGLPVGWTPAATDTSASSQRAGAKDSPAMTTPTGATTNDVGSSGWYGAHLTGGRP